MDPHLSADDIAALIDDDLPADRRAAVGAHLAVCGECRSELVAASELVDSAPAKPRIPVRWLAGAAAVIAVIAILPLVRSRSAAPPANAQRATSRSTTSIQTIGPTSGAKVVPESLTFSWRPLPSVVTYHLFVTDSAGTPVYSLTTGDTIAETTDAHLSPGSRYYWYVDALAADGSSVTSAQVGFSVRDR